MTPADREEIRGYIGNEISKLKRSIDTITELIESDVQSDANDWFSSKESNPSKDINEQALVRARMRIGVLEDVLKKIDSPDYGICTVGKKQIPIQRLKAIPTSTRCVECNS